MTTTYSTVKVTKTITVEEKRIVHELSLYSDRSEDKIGAVLAGSKKIFELAAGIMSDLCWSSLTEDSDYWVDVYHRLSAIAAFAEKREKAAASAKVLRGEP